MSYYRSNWLENADSILIKQSFRKKNKKMSWNKRTVSYSPPIDGYKLKSNCIFLIKHWNNGASLCSTRIQKCHSILLFFSERKCFTLQLIYKYLHDSIVRCLCWSSISWTAGGQITNIGNTAYCFVVYRDFKLNQEIKVLQEWNRRSMHLNLIWTE